MSTQHLMLILISTTLGCTPGTGSSGASIGSSGQPLAGSCLAPTFNPPSSLVATLCPILECGDNAPNAGDGLLFDELDLSGGPNYAGVHLDRSRWSSRVPASPLSATLSATLGGGAASVNIDGDQLEVRDEATGHPYRGNDLIGTVIRFHHDPSSTDFEVRVACYNDRVVPFRPPTGNFVPVYDLQARRLPDSKNPDTGWFEVCNREPLIPDPTWAGVPNHALVFRGDRYTRDRAVAQSASPNWSFIGCNGSAGSKMHLFRHTRASGMDDVGQRTTLLKAITADYCGTGRPAFTRFGHPLAFATLGGGESVPGLAGGSLEALWGPQGAICLDEPRLRPPWTHARVEDSGCGRRINSCTWDVGTWTASGAHVVTALPPP